MTAESIQDAFPNLTSGLIGLLGMEFLELSPDRVTMRCPVRPQLYQPYGLVHGGIYCTMVETAASIAGGLWWGERGNVVGVSNHTDFLRAVRQGELIASATPIHRGRSQQLWLVEIHDQDQRLVARGEVRLQNLASAAELATPSAPPASPPS